MEGERPIPDKKYWDREYPDPEETKELAGLPEAEDPSASGRLYVPGLLKVITVFISFIFVGSIFSSLLIPLISREDNTETSSNAIAQETQAYEHWISSQVSAAVAGPAAVGQARFLGVQFDGSIQHPIVGILVEGAEPQNSFPTAALQSLSIAVLQRLFSDERGQSVTIVWVQPAPASENDQSSLDIILIVGMLRQTAQDLDWIHLTAEDLQNVADLYE
ncbi:hypothetical protein ACFLX9_02635 [Chloroflexota bacterium]